MSLTSKLEQKDSVIGSLQNTIMRLKTANVTGGESIVTDDKSMPLSGLDR